VFLVFSNVFSERILIVFKPNRLRYDSFIAEEKYDHLFIVPKRAVPVGAKYLSTNYYAQLFT